ncbi:hypothetical protein GQ53DRAFT_789708 [Thozetella sp. PMI_491]|nr:hypothetical protein GQ53DRAFT_789708 [Thozetella sp. PMI_491]
MPFNYLMTPPIDSVEYLAPLATWSFLVESSKGETALFDLGVPPERDRFSPAILTKLNNSGWDVSVEKNVADILKDHAVDPAEIRSLVWSHWHWDHIGDMSTSLSTKDLVVGPGFKEAFGAGYPTIADSPAGAFRAYDFFGDGSFYLLDTTGHAIGYLVGLARTTAAPDTFIFIGGDLCHNGGEIGPSPLFTLPQSTLPLSDALHACVAGYRGELDMFRKLNESRGRGEDQPFFDPAMGLDIPLTIKTIREGQVADAKDNVFFVFAHDMSIEGVGGRKAVLWMFLEELSAAVVPS